MEKLAIHANRNTLNEHYADIMNDGDRRGFLLRWASGFSKKLCPDCKGRKQIQLLNSSVACTACDENGQVMA